MNSLVDPHEVFTGSTANNPHFSSSTAASETERQIAPTCSSTQEPRGVRVDCVPQLNVALWTRCCVEVRQKTQACVVVEHELNNYRQSSSMVTIE